MNDNSEKIELSLASESKLSKIKKFLKINLKKIKLKTAIIIAAIMIIGALAFAYKSLFIAATVNNGLISRFAVIERMEKVSGKQALESLITEKLINDEFDKKGITVTDEEVGATLKNIEDGIKNQGGTLEQALVSEGVTIEDLRKQILTNLKIEKFLADKIQVGDDEVEQYMKDNGITVPQGQETEYKNQIRNQLKSGKLNQAASDWIDSLRSQASIRYFVNY